MMNGCVALVMYKSGIDNLRARYPMGGANRCIVLDLIVVS